MVRVLIQKSPAFLGALITTAVFLIYAWGSCRTIYVGDSGDLVTAAATLGIPHPSGYPLYVLLGWLWIHLLPIGSIALRMSLFSAFFGALTCGLLFTTLRGRRLSVTAALVGALGLAFAPSFWSQATVQRVYTLNAFFVVLTLHYALAWYRTRRIVWMTAAAFVAGLGAANHTVMGVVGLAVGTFAIIVEPGLLRRPRHLLACVSAGIAGLLPYLYLPWRSRHDPRLDWGNPETLDATLAVMTRRDFWQRSWLETPMDVFVILGNYLHGLGELTWLGVALAALGLVTGVRRAPVLLPLLVMGANLAAVGLHGSRSDIFIWHRYYIPSFVMAMVLAAWGTDWLARHRGRAARLALLVPGILLVSGWRDHDRSRFRVAEDFSRQLLADVPPGAHLAASDDNILFVLMYLHLVEGVRPDVNLILQGVGRADLGSLRFDPDAEGLFFTHHPGWSVPGLEIVPVGLAFRAVRTGAPEVSRPPPPVADALAGENDPRVPRDYLTSNLIGHFHYMRGVNQERWDWPRARAAFERAESAAPTNDVLFYNLGLIYRRNGQLRRALAAFEHAVEINPRPILSSRPARASDRVQELAAEVEKLEVLETSLERDVRVGSRHGTTDYHRRMAELLRAAGAEQAATGHALLALEVP